MINPKLPALPPDLIMKPGTVGFAHSISGRKEALAIGQVAASAVRMCGHTRQTPAFRLLAHELGVLLSGPERGQCDHDRDCPCPDRQVVCGGRLRRGE